MKLNIIIVNTAMDLNNTMDLNIRTIIANVKAMLVKRGYVPTETQINNWVDSKYNGTAFFSKKKNVACIIIDLIQKTTKKTNIGKDLILELLDIYDTKRLDRLIIVVKQELTSMAKKEILPVIKSGKKVEIFEWKYFNKNVFTHKYQPSEFEILSQHKRLIFESENINKLVKSRVTDPLCRYFGAETGDIIKLTRKNGSVCYRLVVE